MNNVNRLNFLNQNIFTKTNHLDGNTYEYNSTSMTKHDVIVIAKIHTCIYCLYKIKYIIIFYEYIILYNNINNIYYIKIKHYSLTNLYGYSAIHNNTFSYVCKCIIKKNLNYYFSDFILGRLIRM